MEEEIKSNENTIEEQAHGEELELKKPLVTLSGKTISKLNFDFESLTPYDYRQIIGIESRLKGQRLEPDISLSKATSAEFRMGVSWVAALKATKFLCLDDIERLSLSDLLELEKASLFYLARLE